MLFAFLLNQIAFCAIDQVPQIIKEEGNSNYIQHDRIYWPDARVELTHNIFNGIHAQDDGGAIYIGGSNKNNSRVDCIIDDCRFEQCTATTGGAIYVGYAQKQYNFTVFNSYFEGCQSTKNGGAIYHSNTQKDQEVFNVLRCTFKSNKATANGGAIYAEVRDKLVIDGCTFENNQAVSGSSIWLSFGNSNEVTEDDTLIISNNDFKFTPSESNKINVHIQNKNTKNTAIANVYLGGCTFSIENSDYSGFTQLEITETNNGLKSVNFDKCNCVEQQDTVISVPDRLKPINNFVFSCPSVNQCSPTDPDTKPNPPEVDPTTPDEKPDPPVVDPPVDDGEYHPHDRIDSNTYTGESIKLIRSTFTAIKEETKNGGAISIASSKYLNCSLEDCKFESCEGQHGGAIYVSYASYPLNFTAFKSTFLSCKASSSDISKPSQGGAIYVENAQHIVNSKPEYLNIIECTFTSNSASQGGAIYGKVRDLLTIQSCKFENNDATTGSSLFVKYGTGSPKGTSEIDTLIVSDCTFTFNPTETNKINVHIENCKISDTKKSPTVIVFLGGCTFSCQNPIDGMKHVEIIEDNQYAYKSINFNDCNCVGQSDTTVSIPNNYELYNFTFSCSSLDQCSPSNPDKPPNPPDVEEPKPDITPDLEYEQITVRYADTGEEINKNKAEYYSIKATEGNGGAILVNSNRVNLSLTNCKFTLCHTPNHGGAISIKYAGTNYSLIGSITNTVFQYCSADKDGGAIYLEITQPKRHSFIIDKCSFIKNTAGQEGGAIFTRSRDRLKIKDSTFESNKALKQGYSIWCEAGYNAKNDKGNTIILTGNKFTFAPASGSSNVFIQSANGDSAKNANIEIGGCTFTTTTTNVNDFYHLEFFKQAEFESITYSSCNCVQQGSETILALNTGFPINNFHFNCDPSGSCTPGAEIPVPPPEEKPEEKVDSDGYFIGYRTVVVANDKSFNKNTTKFNNLIYASEEGGAINVYRAHLTLFNCTFNKCNAKNGGAIYIDYTKSSTFACSIKKSSFVDCNATTNGGAIYISITQPDTHSVDIDGCEFKTNVAKLGGAIYADARDSLSISNCKFVSNTAKTGSSFWLIAGQAKTTDNDDDKDNNIYLLSNTFAFSPEDGSTNIYIKTDKTEIANANIIMSSCQFSTENGKSDNFMHISVDKSESKFKSIKFPSCICVGQSSSTVSLPEGVDVSNIVYQCQGLNSCPADPDGYYPHDRIPDEQVEPIEVKDSKFLYHINNNEKGGSISINTKKVNCTLNHCKFDSCKAEYGGAIYILYSGRDDYYSAFITKSVFINCEAVQQGGAIYSKITQNSRHSVTITECTFTNNKAKKGGAVYSEARDQFTLTNSVFEDNTATDKGSSLWCRVGWDDRYTFNEVTILNNKFTFTPSKSGQSNVYIDSCLLNADVTPNANLVFGGCTFSAKESTVTKFLNLDINQFKSQFESINFTSCSCVAQDIDTVDIPLKYNPSYFFDFNCTDIGTCKPEAEPTPKPTPDEDGYIPSERINRVEFDPNVILYKVKFVNLAIDDKKMEGGAMYIKNVQCTLNDCLFDSCSSTTKAGAVRVFYSGEFGNYTFSALNTVFKNCHSTSGGAIYANVAQPKRHYLSIERCKFISNKATEYGGAIGGEFRDLFTLQNCEFTNNEAPNGTSVWCKAGVNTPKKNESGNSIVFYGNSFSFKPSQTNAINVYIESYEIAEGMQPNVNLYIGKNTFTSVDSEYQEYKHLIIAEVGKFESLQFNDCNCIQGAESTVSIVAIDEQPNTNNLKFNCQGIDQCPSESVPQPPSSDQCQSFTGRQESFGQKLSLKGNCFSHLSAPAIFDGGAVRVTNAEVEAENCRFIECSSQSNGGAIYVSFSTKGWELEVEKCIFTSCSAGKRGGAIYFINQIESCESSFEGCRFENNTAVQDAGAFYYSPCANSEMKKNIFINNTCTYENAQGSSLYVYIENKPEINSFSKKNRMIKDDEEEVKPVVIEENKFRSPPVAGTQMYINLKKTGQLKFNTNAFSFDKAEEIPEKALHVKLSKDEGAAFSVKDDICVDSEKSCVEGFDPDVKVKTKCNKADSEFDNPRQGGGNKGKSNVGMIVGIVVAVVVVIVVVVVVVVIVLKRKNSARYVSDLNNDDIADNSTAIESTDAPHDL